MFAMILEFWNIERPALALVYNMEGAGAKTGDVRFENLYDSQVSKCLFHDSVL